MSIKDQFSTEEWGKIMVAPMMAGNAVVTAAPSGPIGMIKELGSMASTIAKMTDQPSSNALVQAVLADIKTAVEQRQQPELPKLDAKNVEGLKQQALNMVHEAVGLADAKVEADVAKGYKEFILAIAQKAAEAAKEGGFLGFGGTQVSDAEQAMLSQLKTTLGL